MRASHEIATVVEAKRDAITDDIVALQRHVIPRYEDVRPGDHRASVMPVVVGLAHLLRGAPAGDLIAVVRDASRLRRRAGFTTPELAALVHTYLPPIRRALVDARGLEAGLALFEQLEARVLQLYPLVHAQVLEDRLEEGRLEEGRLDASLAPRKSLDR